MDSTLERWIVDPIQSFLERVLLFLPNLLAAFFIFILGIVLGWLVKYVLVNLFRVVRLDDFSQRAGLSNVLLKGGIREPFSLLLARFMQWVIILAFTIIALNSLNVATISNILERFFLYLPNIFIALFIVFFGYLLSNFFGRAALIASVNAGLKTAGIIGRTVRLAIFLFSLSIALEQLGIGRDTVVITFAIIFGGIVLALSIAFGLGGKDAAKAFLEKHLHEEEKRDTIDHL